MAGATRTVEITAYRAALRREALFIGLWTAVVAILGAVAAAAFGPYRDAAWLRTLISDVPRPLLSFLGLTALDSWSRFTDAILFGLVGPIAFLSFSIGVGSRAGLRVGITPAGNRVALAELAALATGAIGMGIALVVGVLAAAAVIGEPVQEARLAGGVASDVALGIAFGAIAFSVAAKSHRVGLAALVATAAALLADAMNGIGPAVPQLGTVRYLSLAYYAEGGRPLSSGVSPAHVGLLIAAALVAVTVAVLFAVRTPRASLPAT